MSDLFTRGLKEHERLCKELQSQLGLLRDIGQAIINSLESGGRVFLLGNGGSAADAQHIAAEFVGRFKRERRPLPAVALTTDTSNILAIGNDYGFGHIFTRQIEALIRRGDIVWALSTSGSSDNIIEAVHVARAAEACIIGFTGETGGNLKPLCDYCLCVQHRLSDRIQEIHRVAYHLICDYVEQHFTEEKN